MIYRFSIAILVFLCIACQQEMIEKETPPDLKQEIPEEIEKPLEQKPEPKKEELPAISPFQEEKKAQKKEEEYHSFLNQKEKELEKIEKNLQQHKKQLDAEAMKNQEELSIKDLENSINFLQENALSLEKQETQCKTIQKELETNPSIPSPLEKKRSALQEKAIALGKKAHDLKLMAEKKARERKNLLQERANLKDSIAILCPSSLEQLMEEWKAAWKNLYPQSNLDIQYSKSYDIPDTLEQQEEKFALGFSFFSLENSTSYESTIVAFDALAILLYPQNPIENMNIDSLASIYIGTKKKWQEVNPVATNKNIKIYGWEAYSAPFMLLSKIFPKGKSPVAGIHEITEEKQMISEIETTEESIGYIAASYLKKNHLLDKSKISKISNYSMEDSPYPLRYPLYCFSKQENPVSKKFLEFITHALGKKILKENGFLLP